MRNILHLLTGELVRLVKYKIIFFSILVSAIWSIIIGVTDAEVGKALAPMLIMIDGGMMSILLLAASFFLEKQEGTIKTLLVTPIDLWQVLLAKVLSSLCVALISLGLVSGTLWIVHGVEINYLIAIPSLLFVLAAHTAIGFWLTLLSKDFGSLIIRIAGVMILFIVPSFLFLLGLVDESLTFLMILSPSYAAEYLMKSAYEFQSWPEFVASIVYLGALAGLIFPFIVYRKYQIFAIEG